MSWSSEFSGERSPIVTAFHRVAATVTAEEFLSEGEQAWKERLKAYAAQSIMHVNLVVTDEETVAVGRALKSIGSISQAVFKAHKPNTLFLTVTCPLHSCLSLLDAEVRIDLLVMKIPADYAIVKRGAETQSMLEKLQQSPLVGSLGASGFGSTDRLDDFMQTHQGTGKLKVMFLPIVNLPNLSNMAIELVHSYHMNCVALLDENIVAAAESQELYRSLAAKYSISPHLFLLKCLLQLGAILALPLAKLEARQPRIVEELGRLGHPFVHRKEFVSSFKVVSLRISDEDMDSVVAASDELEIHQDESRMHLATSIPASIPFSYC